MLQPPNPVLNEKELELLDDAPEACLRQAVRRGALSLDEITTGLSPRVAAAVQRVATGERPATRSGGLARDPRAGDLLRRGLEAGDDAAPPSALPAAPEGPEEWDEWTRHALSPYSELADLLDEQNLTPSEAMAAAHAIDHALGRYLTGTRYAAP